MPESDSAAVEWIIANTINETARGDPDALASRIVTALGEAGYRILPANGMEDISPGDQSFDELKQLYRSPNGDIWSLARDPATGSLADAELVTRSYLARRFLGTARPG
jgi:hypothetical protein